MELRPPLRSTISAEGGPEKSPSVWKKFGRSLSWDTQKEPKQKESRQKDPKQKELKEKGLKQKQSKLKQKEQPAYTYQSLKDPSTGIRLAALKPGRWDDPIKLNVLHAELSSAPSYQALSYVWGDPSQTAQILIDDVAFNATKSLESALRYLRKEDVARIFWIDAICINQQDIKEKNFQVGRMRNIYENAGKVVAWLGPPDENTASAMSILSGDAPEQVFPYLTSKEEFDAHVETVKAKLGAIHKGYIALVEILERPYWRRAWIIQEVASGRNLELVCGHHVLRWEDAWPVIHDRNSPWGPLAPGRADEYTSKHNTGVYITPANRRMMEMRNIIHAAQPARFLDNMRLEARSERDFYLILKEMRNFLATDARDRVWISLSLSPMPMKSQIEYSWTIGQTFAHSVFVYLSQPSSTLEILEQCDLQPAAAPTTDAIPSWAPDWRSPLESPTTPGWSVYSYSTSGSTTAQYAFLDAAGAPTPTSGPKLRLRGFVLYNIAYVGSSYISHNGLEKNRFFRLLADLTSWVSKSTKDPIATLALVFDILSGCHVHAVDLLTLSRRWFHESRHCRSEEEQAKLVDSLPDEWLSFVIKYGMGRKLCVMTSMLPGLAPRGTLPGDVVAVLYGGRVPFVLRPGADEEWLLVGPAWVEREVMEGRAMGMLDEGRVTEQEFMLV